MAQVAILLAALRFIVGSGIFRVNSRSQAALGDAGELIHGHVAPLLLHLDAPFEFVAGSMVTYGLLTIVWLGFLGVHTCGLIAWVFGFAIFLHSFPILMLLHVVLGSALVAVHARGEFSVARNEAALQAILDRATDGFCTVDLVTGEISNPSPGFVDLFGLKRTCRTNWPTLLVMAKHYDDKKVVQELLTSGGKGFESKRVVTFVIDNVEVSARIIPYGQFKDSTLICFQMQTEKHQVSRESLVQSDCHAGVAGLSPMGHRLSLQDSGCIVQIQGTEYVQLKDVQESRVTDCWLGGAIEGTNRYARTVQYAWEVSRAARGGLLLAVVQAQAKRDLVMHVVDGGYMLRRLSYEGPDGKRVGKSVFDEGHCAEVREALVEFSAHEETDRWPANHEDAEARLQPKDGATIITDEGRIFASAVRVDHPPDKCQFRGAGTRHGAALGLTEWLQNQCKRGTIFVRSDCGAIKILISGRLPEVINVLRSG